MIAKWYNPIEIYLTKLHDGHDDGIATLFDHVFDSETTGIWGQVSEGIGKKSGRGKKGEIFTLIYMFYYFLLIN